MAAEKSEVGQTIRLMREYRGLSQQELGERAGIPETSISRIETGRYGLSVKKLYRLAEAMEVEPADILRAGPVIRWVACSKCRGAGILPLNAPPTHFSKTDHSDSRQEGPL